ncbi:MAG: hypothetical protein DRG78_09385 [Epsilonproteobacteria bacterium]|nr:MAG: hypothetical protein DRG78_09385 [Campylobacterota bacterium]
MSKSVDLIKLLDINESNMDKRARQAIINTWEAIANDYSKANIHGKPKLKDIAIGTLEHLDLYAGDDEAVKYIRELKQPIRWKLAEKTLKGYI